jgi:hypothetical protein
MTTQYTTILKLALPVQGELSGTWGDVVNNNITQMVEQAVAGKAVINTWTGNSHTLTTADGTTSESRCAILELTDSGTALTGAGTVVCPTNTKLYIVDNNTAEIITVQTAAGTGVAVPVGKTMLVYCDGTNVVEGVTHANSLSLGTSTVTADKILDEDNMASDSATAIATQQSIKAYVDSQVGTVDTLSEILANGNTTGANDIDVDSAQKVQFRDADIYLNSSVDGQLDIVADTEIQIAATTVDLNGNLDVSGTALVTGVLTTTAATVFNGGFASNADSTLGTDKKVQFRDSAIYINSSADGQLDIVADTEIQIAATTVDINGTLAFDSLKGTGATTVTNILDEDDMASDSATAIATQQSIKAYVDSQVGSFDTLAEVLAQGNTTGSTDIAVDSAQKVQFRDAAIYINSSVDGQLDIVADTEIQIAATTVDLNGNLDVSGTALVAGIASFTNAIKGSRDIASFGANTGSSANRMAMSMEGSGVSRLICNGPDGSTNGTFEVFNATSGGTGAVGLELNALNGLIITPLAGGHSVFNEGGVDADFRVESDTNTHALFVDGANGNVGIGTSSPRTLLHVTGLTADDDPALGSSAAPVFISNTANSYGLNIGVNNAGAGWLQAQSNTASTAYNLLLNPLGGNVGIGTVLPTNGKLVIEESGTSVGSTIRLIGTNTSGSASQVSHITSYQPAGGAAEASALDFKVRGTDPYATPSTVMTLIGGGNVGIGTGVNIDEILHVEKSSGTTLVKTEVASASVVGYEITKTGATTANWRIADGQVVNGQLEIYDVTNSRSILNADSAEVVINDTSADLDFRVESDTNTHALFVDALNNVVGIATASPATYLSTGGLAVQGSTAADFSLVSTAIASGVNSHQMRYWNDTGTAYEIARTRVNVGAGQVNRGEYQFSVNNGGGLRQWLDVDYGGNVTFNEGGHDSDFRVEGDSNANMFVVDASNDTIGIGTQPKNNNLSPAMHFVSGGTLFGYGDAMYVTGNTYYNDGWKAIATGGGANTIIDSAGFKVYNNASASADAAISPLLHLTVGPSEMVINDDSYDYDFRVETNGAETAFFVDGSTNNIGIQSGTEWAIVGGGNGTSSSGSSIDMGYDATIYGGSAYWAGGLDIGTNFWRDASGYHYKRTSRQATAYQQSSQGASHAFYAQIGGDGGAVISWDNLLYMDRTQTIFNDSSLDIDFRVESDNNAYMFYVDAGLDAIGIGAVLGSGYQATQQGMMQFKNGGSEGTPSDGGIEFYAAQFGDGYSHRLCAFDNSGGDTPLLLQRRNNSATWSTQITFEGNSNNVVFAGTVSKGGGSFKIDHPLPSMNGTHHLVHSFVEGPQADNLYRGRVTLVDGQASVNLDTTSNMTEGTFVLLNRDVQCFTSNETGWTAVRGTVSGNTISIEAQDNTCTDTISWMVVGERHDQFMYDNEFADDDGHIIVEPIKKPHLQNT